MAVAGIICEYNPFHNGHARQFALLRQKLGEQTPIVCLMSGNFVQRGEAAVFDKMTRARAAVLCGADLVLELPVTKALSSAESFASGGVEILCRTGCVDTLCFGCESGDGNIIMSTAKALLRPEFDRRLRSRLETGVSYAAARQQALEDPALAACLTRPNDILAVEYCKALLRRGGGMKPLAIARRGDYLAQEPETENPSALSLRRSIAAGTPWLQCVPPAVRELYETAEVYGLPWGERAVLARLRTMTDAEFEALPYGTEGLWRRFMTACRTQTGVEEILQATKSKRYARTRLQRMLLCAYLGIDGKTLQSPISYVRVLAFNDTGRQLLRQMKREGDLSVVDAGQRPEDASYYALERRCSDLYTLFARDAANCRCRNEEKLRNFYDKNEKNTCKT